MSDETRSDDRAASDIDAPFEALHDPTPPVHPEPRFARTLREQAATAQAESVAKTAPDVRAMVAEAARRIAPGSRGRDHTPVEPAASERHMQPVTTRPVDFQVSGATPYLCVDNGAAALRFYVDAFGAEVTLRVEAADGTIGHAEFTVGSARFMLSDEFPDHDVTSPRTLGGTGVTLHLDVADIEGLFGQTLRYGAFPVAGPADKAHGHRTCVVLDPFGHRWMLSQRIDDVDPDEFARRSPGWRVAGTGVTHPPEPPY